MSPSSRPLRWSCAGGMFLRRTGSRSLCSRSRVVLLEVVVEVVGIPAGIAGAAPASMGVGPRVMRDFGVRTGGGRTHSGSAIGALAGVPAVDNEELDRELEVHGSEVVPQVVATFLDCGGGTKSAGGLAKALTGVLCTGGLGLYCLSWPPMPKSSWSGSARRFPVMSSLLSVWSRGGVSPVLCRPGPPRSI